MFDGRAPGRERPVLQSVQEEGVAQLRIGLLFLLTSATPSRLDGKSPGGESPDSQNVAIWGAIAILLIATSFYLLTQLIKKQTTRQRKDLMQKETIVLYDQAPCGYHSIDGNGVVINMNQTLLRWLGYERHEVVGKMRFIDMIDGTSHEAEEKMRSLMERRKERVDLQLLCKSGERFPTIVSIMPAEVLTGDPAKFFFATLDNIMCHEALERIKTLDKELEAFSYSISHDLRAPLRSIDGYSRILQEDYAANLDDEGRRVLNVVTNNAKRMGRLIDDLLDFGRLGRKALQHANVNMTAIVNNIIQELKAQEPGRNIEVIVDELLPSSADGEMIRQVWFNLLENAVKYSGKKDVSAIKVRSYKLDDSEICYEVKDNGVGFDMQYAGKLFGVFQRLHKMQDFSGTGVGLAIVKRIVSRHGGRVWADAALNQGATFYFTLPVEHETR